MSRERISLGSYINWAVQSYRKKLARNGSFSGLESRGVVRTRALSGMATKQLIYVFGLTRTYAKQLSLWRGSYMLSLESLPNITALYQG